MNSSIVAAISVAACSSGEKTTLTPTDSATAQPSTLTTVSGTRLAVPHAGPAGEWQMPAGDYSSSRYSELATITPANAANLHVSWAFSTGVLRGHEGQPLVIGNTMYVITPYPNVAYAIDLAQPGQQLKWKFRPDNAQQAV